MSGTPPLSPGEKHALMQADTPLGAGQHVQTTLSLPNFIRIVVINLIVLAELFVAMYMAAQNPEAFTPVFFKTFFSLLVPTLILGILSKRLIRPKAKQ